MPSLLSAETDEEVKISRMSIFGKRASIDPESKVLVVDLQSPMTFAPDTGTASNPCKLRFQRESNLT